MAGKQNSPNYKQIGIRHCFTTYLSLPYIFLCNCFNTPLSVPAIDDPNTGIVLWESGAIVNYLVETYDKDRKISFASGPEKFYADQYLFFQASGQGPYFGQFAWFSKFHSEKIPSAIERYGNEIKRLTKVLDGLLSDKEYLVGNKCSYADISFIPWYMMMPFLDDKGELELEKNNPNWAKWIARLHERPAIKKCVKDRTEFMSKGH